MVVATSVTSDGRGGNLRQQTAFVLLARVPVNRIRVCIEFNRFALRRIRSK